MFYHLGQRRGFKSNRKAQLSGALLASKKIAAIVDAEDSSDQKAGTILNPRAKEAEKEEGIVKQYIAELRRKIQYSGARTLGEYLANVRLKSAGSASSFSRKVRGIYADRSMYEEEFNKIFEAQRKFHPEILTTTLKSELFHTIFFQRPLQAQKFLVGDCQFEKNRKRAPKASLQAQEFRILQDINNLQIQDPVTTEFRHLENSERKILLSLLGKHKEVRWSSIRKKLGLHEREYFNLEMGGREKLIGNRTHIILSKILDNEWNLLNDERKDELLTDLFTISRKDALLRRLIEHWKFDEEVAYNLSIIEFEPGYASLSIKAIRKLLPHLRHGFNFHDACQQAGYQRFDQLSVREVDSLAEPSSVRNPIVKKALYETRRVVNAILKKYGKPHVIRIELARDMKLNQIQRQRLLKQQNVNRRLNEEAEAQIRELGNQHPSKIDKLKYKLWKESKGLCPYTGQEIGMNMLFSPEVEIEHIIPYRRCLDDSFMNKTLCMSSENKRKNNRTPYETYSGQIEKYQTILQRIRSMEGMPFSKRRKFEQKEVELDDFVSRQLNDTRYICSEVKKYLLPIGSKISITKGQVTASLRHVWSLNKIISIDGSNQKNREDHRHHAIDAIVIALTSEKLLHQIANAASHTGKSISERGFELAFPWPRLFDDTKAKIDSMIVSHAVRRRLAGSLHDETAYSLPDPKSGKFKYRKSIESFKDVRQINKIVDPVVRQLILQRVEEYGGNIKSALSNPDRPIMHKDGFTPIMSARIDAELTPAALRELRDKRSGKPYKYVKYGNNHHVEIIEDLKTKKWDMQFITMFEASRRAKAEEDIVNRVPGNEKRFVMSLCNNDLVLLRESPESQKVLRVQQIDSSNKRLILQEHTVSTAGGGHIKRAASALKKGECRKLSVSPLGEIVGYSHD